MAREFEKAVELLSVHFNVDEDTAKRMIEFAFEKTESVDVCFDTILSNPEIYGHREVIRAKTTTCVSVPPLGLRPKWLVSENRLAEINEALKRYINANKSIPLEWIEERDELIKYIKDRRG